MLGKLCKVEEPQSREPQEYRRNRIGLHPPRSLRSRCIPTNYVLGGFYFGVPVKGSFKWGLCTGYLASLVEGYKALYEEFPFLLGCSGAFGKVLGSI